MKQLIFTLLYWAGVTRLCAWSTRKQVKILCYHSITEESDDVADPYKLHLPARLFRVHLEHLRQNYHLLSLPDYVAARRNRQSLPDNTVVLTFDDGFRNFYTVAAPILAEFGFPATVFLITGKTSETVLPLTGRELRDERHLAWDEVRNLMRHEHITIGSHTHTHRRLPQVLPEEAQRELKRAHDVLAQRLGRHALALSYPHGQTSPAVQELVAAAGYSCALSSAVGGNGKDADLYALRRIVIASDDDRFTFAARLAGLTWIFGRRRGRPDSEATPLTCSAADAGVVD